METIRYDFEEATFSAENQSLTFEQQQAWISFLHAEIAAFHRLQQLDQNLPSFRTATLQLEVRRREAFLRAMISKK